MGYDDYMKLTPSHAEKKRYLYRSRKSRSGMNTGEMPFHHDNLCESQSGTDKANQSKFTSDRTTSSSTLESRRSRRSARRNSHIVRSLACRQSDDNSRGPSHHAADVDGCGSGARDDRSDGSGSRCAAIRRREKLSSAAGAAVPAPVV